MKETIAKYIYYVIVSYMASLMLLPVLSALHQQPVQWIFFPVLFLLCAVMAFVIMVVHAIIDSIFRQ